MIKGFKYRLYLNATQTQQINQMLGNARFVYNWALGRRTEYYQQNKKKITAFSLMKELTKLKRQTEYEWLNLSVAQSLQASIVNMEKAFTRFFREKKGFPNFKSKHRSKQTVSFPQNTKVDFKNHKAYINKLGWINFRMSREFEGNIKTTTIEKTPSEKYYISFTVELADKKIKQKPIKEKTAVGIDTGIKVFATLSDGKEIENPKHLKASLQRLKILQKRLSKKQKGSNNRNKARKQLARLHEHIANQRLDFLHQQTYSIAKNYDSVCVENLNIAGMLKNHHLAQSIADLGLGAFYRLLEYKMKDSGGNYIVIGRFQPSSKMCMCGVINNDLTLSDRSWTCKECGTSHENRDLLAARNILRFGLEKQNLINKNTAGTVGRASGDAGNGQVYEGRRISLRTLRS